MAVTTSFASSPLIANLSLLSESVRLLLFYAGIPLSTSSPCLPCLYLLSAMSERYKSKEENKKVYVIFEGRRPGIYKTWHECNREVNKFPGNCYVAYDSLEQATEDFKNYNFSKINASNSPSSSGSSSNLNSCCAKATKDLMLQVEELKIKLKLQKKREMMLTIISNYLKILKM